MGSGEAAEHPHRSSGSLGQTGVLCIGDAAHAMSPIGGVGVNLAIQDAVAAANALIPPLRQHRLQLKHLLSVQRRREFPTRAIQFCRSNEPAQAGRTPRGGRFAPDRPRRQQPLAAAPVRPHHRPGFSS